MNGRRRALVRRLSWGLLALRSPVASPLPAAFACLLRTLLLRTPVWLLVWFVLLYALPWHAAAQSAASGSIGGTVLDSHSHPVSGILVVAHSQASGNDRVRTTDESGYFQFPELDPGLFTVTASGPGFAASHLENVEVEVGRLTGVTTRVAVAGPNESVTVLAETHEVDLTTSSVATNVDQAQLESLPSNSRRWSEFALLTPAVTSDQEGDGLLSFRGISTLLNNSTLDGLDNNQAFFSEERGRTRIAYSISQASVQEFQVNASNYSAEWGRAAGGVVNTVTRSGGNQLHGHAFYYDRTNLLGAHNAFTTLTEKNAAGEWVAVPYIAPDSRQQMGLGIGGHLAPGRIFWFFSFDRYSRNFPGLARATHPDKLFATPTAQAMQLLGARIGTTTADATASYNQVLTSLAGELGPVPRTATQTTIFPKIDWQAGDRNHFTLQTNVMRWASPAGVQTATTSSYGIASFGNHAAQENWYIGRWSFFLSPNVVNDFRYQYGRDFQSELPQPRPLFEQPFALNQWGQAPQISITDGFTFGNPAGLNRIAYPDETRSQFVDTLTWVYGKHIAKIGYDFDHVVDLNNSLYNQTGTYSYANVENFAADLLAPSHCDPGGTGVGSQPCYAWYTQAVGPSIFTISTADTAFFYADEWRPNPAISISYGVRYEYEHLPDTNKTLVNTDIPGSKTLPHNFYNVAPRLGFAINLSPLGTTVLRGGYGIYYSRIANSTAFSALTNTGSPNGQRSYYFKALDAGAPPFPYVFAAAPVNLVKPNAVYFDQHFNAAQIGQAEISIEQVIAKNTTLSFSYLNSKGQQLPNFVDTNIDLTNVGTLNYTVVDSTGKGPLKAGIDAYQAPFFTQRINPNYQQITDIFSSTDSSYSAMLVKVSRHLHNGVQVHASYTFAHATDYHQNSSSFVDGNDLLDPRDFALENGTSSQDVRHRLTGGLVISPHVPLPESLSPSFRAVLGGLVEGYKLATVFHVQTGLPYTMHTTGSIPSVKYVDSINRTETLSGLGSSINGSGGDNRIPEVGRNTFRYPATYSVDARFTKSTRLAGRLRGELSGEVFNVLNHQNVTSIDTTGYTISAASSLTTGPRLTYQGGAGGKASFGSVTNTNSTTFLRERKVQLSFRLVF